MTSIQASPGGLLGSLRTSAALLFLLLLAAASTAAAQAQDPVRFLIERIAVEGVERETARRIVLSESLLQEGRTYSEQELREAIYRVKRLPFVVDAGMALRKGSERGAYELVIAVEMARPLAFSLDVSGFGRDDDSPFRDERFDWSASGTLGARKFVGARGLLFGSVQGYEGISGQVVQLGYTHYGLFRSGGYATVALSSGVGDEYSSDDLQTSLQLGIPITGSHALRTTFAWSRHEDELRLTDPRVEIRFDAWQAQLEWIYDTTDDPIIPSEGLKLTSLVSHVEVSTGIRSDRPVDFISPSESTSLRLHAGGRKYWALTSRQSIAVGGGYEHGETDLDQSFFGGSRSNAVSAEVLYAVSPWGFETSGRLGDLRLETGLGINTFKSSSSFGDREETALSLGTALLFRNAWGLVRIGVFYIDELGGES